MLHAVDADVADGISLESREQDAPQGIAYRHTISWLEWSELELAEGVGCFEHQHLVGFLKC